MSNKPTRPENKPLNIELEGEKMNLASCNEECDGDNADISAASGSIQDDRKHPKKLHKMSEHVSECLKSRSRGHSPRKAWGDPDDLGGEMAAPGGPYTYQEGPIGGLSDDSGKMSVLDQDTWPGGCRGEQVESRGFKGIWDCRQGVDSAEHDRKCPRSNGNTHTMETNAQCRDNWPGGQLGEQVGLGDVKGDWKRWSDAKGDKTSGGRGGKDGATSSAGHNSNWVGMTSLASNDETDQYEQCKRMKVDVSRPSTPPTDDPRWPTEAVNPLH